jgi:hypothetical protein
LRNSNKSSNAILGILDGIGLVKINDHQHLPHFPAQKIKSNETNKTKGDFSKGGLKYFDMGLDN